MADNITPDNESFKDQRDILKEINAELGKQIDYVKDASKLYSGLTGIAKKLQNDEESISRLNVKQLKDLKAKSIINLRDLKDAAEKLSYQNASTDAEVALLIAKENSFRVEQELVDNIGKRLEQEIKINETLGTTGALLKGMSKIPIVGNIIDTNKALDASRSKIKDGSGKFSAMGAAVKSVGADILTNLTDPLTTTVFLAKNFLDILVGADKATGELAKGMNMSYSSAASLRTELSGIAASTGDAFVNTRTLQESLIAVGQSLGTNAKLNKEDLITFTQLREEAGFTNEELIGIQKLTLATGGNLKDNTKQFLGTVKALSAQNGLILNEKQLLKEVSNTSASIKLSIGGTTKQLAEAAVKAKQFGINLEQADKISSGLLDFESSISNELEAELLTGKDLNLEKARLLALNGDIAGASAEILKQVKGSAEFTAMNRIQQEAIAKATGLSRDELAASLIEREALQKIGVKDAAAAKEKYETLRKTMTAEEASKALGDEALATQYEQNSNSEKFEKIIEKIRDAFTPIAETLLPKISEALGWFSENTNTILNVMKAIGVVIGVQMVGGIIKATAQMGPLIAKAAVLVSEYVAMAAAWAIANPVSALVGLGVAAGVGALVYSQMQDGMIAPDGGLMVSGEKGTYKLDKNDHVIAGTDLNKPITNKGGGSVSIDISPLVTEMQNVKVILSQILAKEGKVTADTNEIGKAANMASYKVFST